MSRVQSLSSTNYCPANPPKCTRKTSKKSNQVAIKRSKELHEVGNVVIVILVVVDEVLEQDVDVALAIFAIAHEDETCYWLAWCYP